MRRFLLTISLIFTSLLCYPQQQDDIPFSWQYNLNTRIRPIELPPIDLNEIRREDLENDKDKSLPWRYGVNRPLSIDIRTHGVATELPNGGKIYQLAIRSPHAINLSLNFSEFYLPPGSRLHLFNGDKTDVSRTHNKNTNRPNERFGSWFINGDVIWVEYFEPASVSSEPRLRIDGLIHGYRLGKVSQFVDGMRGLNDSGDCNYDVNCPTGEDFESHKDMVKKAVALLNLGNGYLCSAVLMNNTERDKSPYLLTANHCLENSDPSLWSVRFNWMSPAPVCGTGEESSDIQTNFTMSGADLRANNPLSDFALVELYNAIPDNWDIAFAGWDITDDLPEFEVGIHHPNGDIMKVCRDDSGAVKEIANGTEVWLIKGATAGNGDGWEIGTTESGSSGSPLFNQDGRVIGQLYAGQSFCDGTQNNGDYDVYGRLAVSFNAGNNPSNRLADWLDPIGSGQTTEDTMLNFLSVQDNELTGQLQIYPNPATTEITIMNSLYPNLNYELFTVTGKRLSEGSVSNSMNTIDVQAYSEGIYFLRLTDEASGDDITKKVIIDR